MKHFWFLPSIVFVLLASCSRYHLDHSELAVDVPRLTRSMHAAVIRMNHPCDSELLPGEVNQAFGMVINENPALDLFNKYSLRVMCINGEIDLLFLDKDTGKALFEDISCTPFTDRRWNDSYSPPQSFTISLPQACE